MAGANALRRHGRNSEHQVWKVGGCMDGGMDIGGLGGWMDGLMGMMGEWMDGWMDRLTTFQPVTHIIHYIRIYTQQTCIMWVSCL